MLKEKDIMTEITAIEARKIYDSRGTTTIETELTTYDGRFIASVPAGTSTGEREAKSVAADVAVKHVNEIISKKIIGMDPTLQNDIDATMLRLDGTADKGNLGANAILSVSVAACKAAAAHMHQEVFEYVLGMVKNEKRRMPLPYLLVAEGGKHSSSGLAVQEFMILPRLDNFTKSFEAGVQVYHKLKKLLESKGMPVNVGYEGAFAPTVSKTEQVLDLISKAIEECGFRNNEIALAIDSAASSFYKDGKYAIDGLMLTGEQLVDHYMDLIDRYKIVSVEDPFDENDWDSWALLTDAVKSDIRVIGDDLTTTNEKMIQKAFETRACNTLLLKINQIGTVTESINAWKAAHSHKWPVVVSHRSGETNDDFIADLAVGLNADAKLGAPCRGERLAKYNRLLKIDNIIRGLNP